MQGVCQGVVGRWGGRGCNARGPARCVGGCGVHGCGALVVHCMMFCVNSHICIDHTFSSTIARMHITVNKCMVNKRLLTCQLMVNHMVNHDPRHEVIVVLLVVMIISGVRRVLYECCFCMKW